MDRLGWLLAGQGWVVERWLVEGIILEGISDEWTVRRVHDYRDGMRYFEDLPFNVKNGGQVRPIEPRLF